MGLQVGGTSPTAAREECRQPLQQTYDRKWGTKQFQMRANIMDFINQSEDSGLVLDWSLIVRALDSIAKHRSRDSSGVSVLIIRIFAFACPSESVALFSNVLQQSAFMESFIVEGSVYGKDSKTPAKDKTRAILPLPAVLAVADAIVASIMNDFIDTTCIPPCGVMFGARKGTQVLDIAHAAQLHMQKGGDNHGEAGLAQGDVATYYDSLNCLRIARCLHESGLPYVWASAFLRVQMLPRVQLTAGQTVTFAVGPRVIGTLTGSRSAVSAGRVPIESVACSTAAQWEQHGTVTDTSIVRFAVWVDNYYAFGKSMHDAIAMAEVFEEELMRKWGLSIKPCSRSVMSPLLPDDSWDDIKWPRVEQAEVLGHLISSDASPWPCWHKTEKAMWGAFWGNCVGPRTHGLNVQERCKLLNRSVRPALNFRNTRWPFTKSLADQQNRTQRLMLARFVQLERQPSEDLEIYCRRKMRIVGNLARHQGLCGTEHARRVFAWADHLQRPQNHSSLASQLYLWHDAEWLQNRRIESGIMRPATRALPGYLPKRWDESLESARTYLQQ